MSLESINTLLEWAYHNPYWAIVITFIIAFLETFAIIGILLPGAVILTILGTFIGVGFLPGLPTMMAAMAGAIMGDMASYVLGHYYHQKIRRIWPLSKYPHWLTKGEKFFQKYGSKSVFFARFVGPVRPVVPLLAGMLNMHIGKFVLANVTSAIIWVPTFLLPGILIGVASVELAPATTLKLLVYLGLSLLGIWLVIQLFKLFFWQIYRYAYIVLNRTWRWLRTHPRLNTISKLMYDPEHPYGPGQLTLLLTALIFFFMLVFVLLSIHHQGIVTYLNSFVHYLFRDFRNETLDYLAIAITVLGDKKLIALFAAILITTLLAFKHWRAAFYSGLVMGLTYLSVGLLKMLIISPRPLGTVAGMGLDSFPSGHATLSTSLFLFLAIIIARHSSSYKRTSIYLGAFAVIILVILSRLYLGAHWLSDVFGSLLLAISIVLLITIPYRHIRAKRLNVAQFNMIIVILFSAAWLAFTLFSFSKETERYKLIWPQCITDMSTWKNSQPLLPLLYADERIGKPSLMINMQWADSLENITQILHDHGWETYTPGINLETLAQRLSVNNDYHVTFLPALFHGQKPSIIATSNIPQQSQQLIIRLWPMNIVLTDRNTTVWAASVKLRQRSKTLFSLLRGQTITIDNNNDAISALLPDLEDYQLNEYYKDNGILIIYASRDN